ncbi:MAG: type III-B CRISPR module RAMP protein Cmr1 [Fimbriimonadales bacterium]|nr:type III-B CRISPR module RAMP protein Cmr1 [Fimbriimonadales bacterium]
MRPASLHFVVREPGDFLRLRVSLLTPMLGGGPSQRKPDLEQPFRAKSIRGNLRWWYRRVVSAADQDELWEKESQLFGSAGRDPDDAQPGRVRIAVDQERAPESGQENVSALSLHRYAWGFFGKPDTIRKEGPFLLRKHSAVVTISGLDDDCRLAVAAWLLFGGIGARTRRGFGSLRCEEGAESLPDYDDVLQALRSGGLAIAGGKGCLVFRSRATQPKHGRVEEAGLEAWQIALGWYEAFRKGNLSPNLHRDSDGPNSHSRWPEANSVRLATGRRQTPEAAVRQQVFPRASLGLPLAVRSTPNPSQYGFDSVELEVEGGRRWPSPVLTKAVWRDGEAEPTIVILLGGGPRPGEVRASGGNTVAAESLSAKEHPTEWYDGQKFRAIPEIQGDTAREKLASYLRFVKQKGEKVWEEVL